MIALLTQVVLDFLKEHAAVSFIALYGRRCDNLLNSPQCALCAMDQSVAGVRRVGMDRPP